MLPSHSGVLLAWPAESFFFLLHFFSFNFNDHKNKFHDQNDVSCLYNLSSHNSVWRPRVGGGKLTWWQNMPMSLKMTVLLTLHTNAIFLFFFAIPQQCVWLARAGDFIVIKKKFFFWWPVVNTKNSLRISFFSMVTNASRQRILPWRNSANWQGRCQA